MFIRHIHCNKCFNSTPAGEATYWLTDCGHVLCQGCLDHAAENHAKKEQRQKTNEQKHHCQDNGCNNGMTRATDGKGGADSTDGDQTEVTQKEGICLICSKKCAYIELLSDVSRLPSHIQPFFRSVHGQFEELTDVCKFQYENLEKLLEHYKDKVSRQRKVLLKVRDEMVNIKKMKAKVSSLEEERDCLKEQMDTYKKKERENEARNSLPTHGKKVFAIHRQQPQQHASAAATAKTDQQDQTHQTIAPSMTLHTDDNIVVDPGYNIHPKSGIRTLPPPLTAPAVLQYPSSTYSHPRLKSASSIVSSVKFSKEGAATSKTPNPPARLTLQTPSSTPYQHQQINMSECLPRYDHAGVLAHWDQQNPSAREMPSHLTVQYSVPIEAPVPHSLMSTDTSGYAPPATPHSSVWQQFHTLQPVPYAGHQQGQGVPPSHHHSIPFTRATSTRSSQGQGQHPGTYATYPTYLQQVPPLRRAPHRIPPQRQQLDRLQLKQRCHQLQGQHIQSAQQPKMQMPFQRDPQRQPYVWSGASGTPYYDVQAPGGLQHSWLRHDVLTMPPPYQHGARSTP